MALVEERSISLGPWGGSGGGDWSFKALSGVKGIIIGQGGCIFSISFLDASGQQSPKFGGNDPNDFGQETTINFQWPSEYLMSISGSYGAYRGIVVITSLSFHTNRTRYGPFGNISGGTEFAIPTQDSVIVGFHGASGYYLDSLGIDVKPVDAAGSISFGIWGRPWSFKASSAINEIVVHHGNNIKSISFGDADGNHSVTFGGDNPNDVGEKKTIEIDWPSEYLTSISGSRGHSYPGVPVITSLSFITNRSTYGPFGATSSSDHSFSIPIRKSIIVGFHGRADLHLNDIGIFAKPDYVEGTISMGPWGGSGGNAKHFIASRGIIQILIGVGPNVINSIAFRDIGGLYSGKCGGMNPDYVDQQTTINIDWPSEYLISAAGTFRNHNGTLVISTLSFITNRTTYGPYGTNPGTPFSVPMEGNVIVGFHGRGGDFLDSIGFYAKPLKERQ